MAAWNGPCAVVRCRLGLRTSSARDAGKKFWRSRPAATAISGPAASLSCGTCDGLFILRSTNQASTAGEYGRQQIEDGGDGEDAHSPISAWRTWPRTAPQEGAEDDD